MGTPAFQIPTQVLFREVGGEMVLLNLDTEQYFGLSEVGAEIVKRVTDLEWESALRSLEETFDVDPTVLRTDIDELVAELVSAGLLDRESGGP